MNGDKMTPNERWQAVSTGNPVDRVPTFPALLGHAGIMYGYPNLGAFYEHPEICYKTQKIARELYKYDQPIQLIPPGYFSAEWGTKILFPYNPKMGSVAPIDPIVKTPEDVDKLQIPDPKTAYGFKEFTDTAKKAISQKDPIIVFILGGCITACAPMITDVETFMRWLIYEPETAKKLLAKSRDFAVRAAEYFVRELGAGNFIVGTAFPTDSNTLISPKQFGEFVLPTLSDCHQKILNLGVPQIYIHWCSNHNANIKAGHVDKIPVGKPGIIGFGPEVDLKVAVERFGNKHVILGNIDPPSMMLKTFDEVMQLAKQEIEKGKHSPKGYCVGVGCELPPRTPPANIYALVKAAREYGRY